MEFKDLDIKTLRALAEMNGFDAKAPRLRLIKQLKEHYNTTDSSKAEKELQKQLITEITEDDQKSGLYEDDSLRDEFPANVDGSSSEFNDAVNEDVLKDIKKVDKKGKYKESTKVLETLSPQAKKWFDYFKMQFNGKPLLESVNAFKEKYTGKNFRFMKEIDEIIQFLKNTI